MHICIVSLFEPTPVDNTRPMRYMGIAQAALKAGHEVTQISCTFRHSTKLQRFNDTHTETISDNYRVIFVYGSPYKRNVSFRRLHAHRKYAERLINELDKIDKPDCVLLALPPLVTADKLTAWGKRHHIPVYLDIIDPWPDIFSILFPKVFLPCIKLLMQPMYQQLRRSLKRCAGVIAISDEYIQWAKGFGYKIPKTSAFLPSVPVTEVQQKISSALLSQPRKDEHIFRCIYAGNLGVAYDIPTILKAASIIEQKFPGRTKFIFAGAGHYESLIRSSMNELPNIEFLGRIGYDELMQQYAYADAGLAQYGKGATQSITYKFFDYLGAGLPIFNSLMSEMAKLTEQHKVGFNNAPGDFQQLAANISLFLEDNHLLQQYKKNAVLYACDQGDNDVVYSRLVQFITS